MPKTRQITITIPEYLYEASTRLTTLGLFRDMSDLLLAGLRREMLEAQHLLDLTPENWTDSLEHLRLQIQAAQTDSTDLSEEALTAQMRKIRQEVWADDYQPYYTVDA